ALAISALAGPCHAQSTATISGIVKSTKGKRVEGAALAITGLRTAEKRSVRSATDGAFVVPQLPADQYRIDVTCDDCADLSTTVEVGVGQNRRVELEVNLESSSTTIKLDTSATTLDASSGRLGSNVTAQEMSGLPVNGGTYSQLELGAPGAL